MSSMGGPLEEGIYINGWREEEDIYINGCTQCLVFVSSIQM